MAVKPRPDIGPPHFALAGLEHLPQMGADSQIAGSQIFAGGRLTGSHPYVILFLVRSREGAI